jgi:hypothetical protein
MLPEPGDGTPDHLPPDDEAIRALVRRLSRRHRSGGRVIERAAVVASGADGKAIIDWIVAHDGRPETDRASAVARGGLYGARAEQATTPQRYVLPAGALDSPER